MDDKGSDFNFTDPGHVTQIPHQIRINKRPLTGKPKEHFGMFSESLFSLGSGKENQTSLQQLLDLEHQNVIMLDMRGEGTGAHLEFD